MNNKLTVIVPVYGFNKTTEELLNKCLNSLKEASKIMLVVPKADYVLMDEYLEALNQGFDNLTIVVNDGDTSQQAQLNLGVEKSETDYVMFMQMDDTLNKTYFTELDKYLTKNISEVYLNINLNHNDEIGTVLQNEVAWANGFTTVVGRVDLNTLLEVDYNLFSINGMVINKNDFKNIGGFKASMPIAYEHEFLLRLTNNNKEIMVIPRIGNKHLVNREDGLTMNLYKTKTPDEFKFWQDLALEEYHFTNDREIAYNKAVD